MAWATFLKRERGEEGEVGEDNNVFMCVYQGEKIGGGERARERRPLLLL